MTEKQGRRNQKNILADLEAKPVSLNDLQLLLVPSDFGQIRVKTCSIKWPLIIACPPPDFQTFLWLCRTIITPSFIDTVVTRFKKTDTKIGQK